VRGWRAQESAWSGNGGAGGGFNFKDGSYGSLNGSTSAKSRWRNVRFWTGGAGGEVADAGAKVDAGADAGEVARDAGSAPDEAPRCAVSVDGAVCPLMMRPGCA
jgi:hypothetical protein